MKISIIGAGNVGSLTAMRLAQERIGDILLVDIVKGLARGKGLDLEDASPVLKYVYKIEGTDDIQAIKDSDIIVITAGLARKPGMTREELCCKNAAILKEICLNIKKLAPASIVVIVTNPLDLMTRFALEATGFKPNKVLGMGITLDAARFANIISCALNIPHTDIVPTVIGSHGEGMLPLPRLTHIKGISLEEFVSEEKVKALVQKTVARGAEIVSLLGSGSAYFAPSAAAAEIVRAIAKDEKRILGVSAYLNGEYGIKDTCIGVPCRLGKSGVEQIIELGLNSQEKAALQKSAALLREQYKSIKL
jgi:malate dehydrogenase